jgi:inner membrane protein
MMAKTHVAFAASLTFLPFVLIPELSEGFSKIEVAIIAGGVFIGSLFPDIDEPNSTISRSTIFTLLFSWILILSGNKHRGITHKFLFTLFFLLAAFALDISNSVSENIILFAYALTFGILAHQLGDMMSGGGKNKGGIYNYFSPLYTPNDTTKFLPYFMRCKINGIKEHLCLVLFTLFNIYSSYILLASSFSIQTGGISVNLF